MELHALMVTAITALISSTVAAVVSSVVTKVKTARAKDQEAREAAQADAEETRGMLRELIRMTCRLCIYDEHFSIDEKLDAYEIYRDNGWNHQTKTHMDELVGGDVDEYLEKHERKVAR